jgi:hypothetical protein
VNPRHLWLGTNSDNIRDAFAKGRMRRDGEYSNARKLTAAQVIEIHRRKAAGERSKALAIAFGLHPTTVNAIVRGSSWKRYRLHETPRQLALLDR